MRATTVPLIAFACLASLASCGEPRRASRDADPAQPRVLATVNGAAITDRDVAQRTAAATGGAPGHDASANVLQTLVREELIYQKGVQLGLDREPGYRDAVEDLEAQLRAFKRREMSSFYRTWVGQQAAVTDAEAQAYFDANAAFIRTRFHVLQIFYKGNGSYPDVLRDHQDVKGGAPFEQVAARRFGGSPPSARPGWDLGEMYWFQIPRYWRGVVDRLEPGQVSDVIEGENERFWVIKLAGKTVDPRITFATEKERILGVLRQQKADEIYDRMLAEVKANARIVYSKQ